MREIKFRGLSIEPLVKTDDWLYDTIIHVNYDDKKAYIGNQEIKFESVGQYTGLKDKYRKEIYEGDIGYDDRSECYGIVTFDDGAFNYEWENICELLSETHIEIVGNIYDNPELLEENNESR